MVEEYIVLDKTSAGHVVIVDMSTLTSVIADGLPFAGKTLLEAIKEDTEDTLGWQKYHDVLIGLGILKKTDLAKINNLSNEKVVFKPTINRRISSLSELVTSKSTKTRRR